MPVASKADPDAVRAAYESGEPILAIARNFGMGTPTIHRWADKHGWRRKAAGWGRPRDGAVPEWHARAAALVDQGWSLSKVAKRMGKSVGGVAGAVAAHRRRTVEVPAWVPITLAGTYRDLAAAKGEFAAAEWARNAKRRAA